MKALIKPQSSQYFRKYEKPAEDPEITMNNIQAKKIAQKVGIDISETKQFNWFFQLITKLKLPQNYTRYLNSSKDEVIYFNEVTHEQSFQHPSENILKIFFYETLANNKTIYTFLDKQTKLLPFVEEKMLRQSIGLNSKRRQAQKVNLQKDASGRMVMSKLQKINPDFKALLTSRSYMLKMLVEKVFTRKQIVGKGKRANAFLATIAEYRQLMKQFSPQKEDDQYINQQNLALYQTIFQNASYYYLQQFKNIQDFPSTIINSRQYLQSTPENVLKNTFLLNIDKDNIQLYWLARMMDCLPLPPNWTKKKGTIFDSYFYEPEKLLFDIHPSYIYIMYQLNQFKSTFKQLGAIKQNYYLNMRQLNFYDFFQRKYTVDMYGYIQNAQKTKKIARKQTQAIENRNIKESQASDWMVLEGLKNTPITQETYVLTQDIERFWDSLDFKEEPWRPAISPYGEVVWSSNVNFKSINFNPYRAKLTNIVRNQTKKLPVINQSDLKHDYKTKSQQKGQDQIYLNLEKIESERSQFLKYYLSHAQKALPWPYQLKQHYNLLDQNNYFDQIFVSPFMLDMNIINQGQEIPLWLQKARAKKHTIDNTNLLIFNNQDFVAIKEKIALYALDMTSEHEPHLLEETEKKINRINNPQDLIKFLHYINDIDLRQQRKKQYLDSLKQVSESSDIFGSEISQLEVQERLQEEDADDIQQKKSVDQEIKQPSIHQKSVHELSQQSFTEQSFKQEENIVVDPRPIQRQQYSFLQNFLKKPYIRHQNLIWRKQSEIERELLEVIAMKQRKCKYKTGLINKKVSNQIRFACQIINGWAYIDQQNCGQQRKSLKKNLSITSLRSSIIPYRFDVNLKIVKNLVDDKQLSEYGCSEITDYDDYQSEISNYDSKQIQQMINEEIKKKKTEKQIVKQVTERSYNQHQVTADTIQLEPIRQIKPQISLDPVLRHVKSLSNQLYQFRSTFNAKAIAKITTKDPFKDNIKKTGSLKNLITRQSQYASTPVQIRSNSGKKIDIESKLSFVKKQGFGSLPKFEPTQKAFHRVCLQKTASHFLEKEVFLKKGDLITMQARKSLLSKGRGIETYISKFY